MNKEIEVIWYNILSEDEDIFTYNWEKDYYEKIDIKKNSVATQSLFYYYENNTYITVDAFEKFSSKGLKEYEIIDKITSTMLDDYANNLEE